MLMMNNKLTIASILAATVLVAGMFAFTPIATMAFNANNSGWHPSASDGHYPTLPDGTTATDPCATDEDLEAGLSETNGIWYHKTSPNEKEVFACKDHPTEQPEDDE
jgi:hypothetical protein